MRRSVRVIEGRLRTLLRCWSFGFALLGAALAIDPGWVVRCLNTIGVDWFHWGGPLMTPPTDRLFSSLACALLLLLALMAHNAARDLRHRLVTVRGILLTKAVTGTLFAIALVMDARYFAYAAGVAADAAIFASTYYCYRHARYLL